MKKIFTTTSLLLILMMRLYGQEAKLQEGFALKYLVQLPLIKSLPTPVIILLHGYGSDERDLFELKDYFPKNYLIVSARAPYPLPGGHGYQWYEFTNNSGSREGRKDQVDKDRELIGRFITQITGKYNGDTRQVYLMGFSQGAIMSYEVGLTDPGKVKGIGVLSGKIIPSLKPLIKNTPALKQLRIFISHGMDDKVIPFEDGKAANIYLTGLGLRPEFHQYPGMAHAISKDALNDLLKWLK